MDIPKYAKAEAERRFLVTDMPPDLLRSARCTLIEDLYLDGGRLRLRKTIDPLSGVTGYKLGKKYPSPDPDLRPVVSVYLDDAEYRVLAALPGNTLAKRRYRPDMEDLHIAVDVFEGPLAGLVLAEIEAATADQLRASVAPDWAAREVTADPFFQGGNLARLTVADLAARLSPES